MSSTAHLPAKQIALPIDPELPKILTCLRESGALVLVAEPGAGKTTRVPRALLDLQLPGEIVVLEPRRVAARMAARRVAEELGEPLGERVGYTVRFEDISSKKTRVRFVTEGILTRRFATDPNLEGVSAVVLDEFHERHLHGDLAAAWLRDLRTRRPELLVCVMSATLDAESAAAFFDAQTMHVTGRTYPVTVSYLGADDRPLESQVASGVRSALAATDGDVLVFLPGAREIRKAEEALAPLAAQQGLVVLPLHGDLPPEAQDRALAPCKSGRKVILSTNIAESSLTIDGVHAVVDAGLERQAGFDPWSGLSTLETVKASRASCTQRAGRAGRTAAGYAFRLFTEAEFQRRPAQAPPEFARADLSETELLLASLKKQDLKFLDPPKEEARTQARALLARIEATDSAGNATGLGNRILKLPLSVRLGCLALRGSEYGVGETALLAACLLGERDVRLESRWTGPAKMGMGARHGRASDHSDVETLIELYREVEYANFSQGAIRSAGLDAGAVGRVRRAFEGLKRRGTACRGDNLPVGSKTEGTTSEALRRAMLRAFPDRVAKRRKPGATDLAVAGVGVGSLADSSVVRDAEWMVCPLAAVRRGRLEVESASAIEPLWLVDAFADKLVEEKVVTYNEQNGRVVGLLRTTYDGIVLDESRFVPPPDLAAHTLAKALLAKGAHRLAKDGALERLVQRVQFARRFRPALRELDDTCIEDALASACEGCASLDDLRDFDLLGHLVQQLPKDVDTYAPDSVRLTNGRVVNVEYDRDKDPWIASYLQDFCGNSKDLSLGGVPLTIHLLAPNKRSVQITRDLPSFFKNHYPALRKELMRKYPKHAWPEDPSQVIPPRFR